MLAKLGRILTIGEELDEICSSDVAPDECHGLNVPSVDDPSFQNAVARLRSGVEIWINGTGEIPFVYDSKWGGLVSCGCDFNGNDTVGICRNKFPECPAFADPGLNFGNGTFPPSTTYRRSVGATFVFRFLTIWTFVPSQRTTTIITFIWDIIFMEQPSSPTLSLNGGEIILSKSFCSFVTLETLLTMTSPFQPSATRIGSREVLGPVVSLCHH